MSIRTDIAAALDGVTVDWRGDVVALTGTASQPDIAQPWSAWPAWRDTSWLTACIDQRRWYVLVVLPAADPATFTDAGDQLVEPVRDALEKLGQVELAEPVIVVAADPATAIPALRFTLTT